LEAFDLKKLLAERTPMVIGPGTTADDEKASRADIGWLNECGVGVQQYHGVPPWEWHPSDELLHVLDGVIELTLIEEDGQRSVITLSAGCVCIVPRKHWHRPVAKTMVTLLGATPTKGSKHGFGEDPPA
jgi:mannose-6-phosphate isomerase-like protein (cupin superfamily)